VSLWELLRSLPLRVEGYELEPLSRAVSSAFTRRTTVVRLHGAGADGVGEDVTYEEEVQERFQAGGDPLDLRGPYTLESLSQQLDELGLSDFRRFAFESAALDLALRQAGRALHEVVGRDPRPVRFVVSTALADGSAERLRALAGHRFKVDAEAAWDEEVVSELAALGAVDVVDFKEAYSWRAAERTPPASLYRLVVEALPAAILEDPGLADPEKAAILEPHRERVSWDAPIHSLADVDRLPFPPRVLNSKPSRLGSLRRLCELYDACRERGIALYGGGQFELGPGRGQIQYLASLFHPDAPNDVAPGGYNDPEPPPGLPRSPLHVVPDRAGFRALQG